MYTIYIEILLLFNKEREEGTMAPVGAWEWNLPPSRSRTFAHGTEELNRWFTVPKC